jgi:hypothetical protein
VVEPVILLRRIGWSPRNAVPSTYLRKLLSDKYLVPIELTDMRMAMAKPRFGVRRTRVLIVTMWCG